MVVTIGIVGAGNRGQIHAEQYADLDTAELVAVADIDPDARTALAEANGATAYADYHEMLEAERLDAVSICVHNNLHRPVTEAAARAGCHVFCEKPIAATVADAKAMVAATNSAGVKLGVQNHELFSPETRAAKRLIEHDELGELYYGRAVYSRRRGRPYVDGYGTPAFVTKESAGGGPVIDIGTYAIGRLLYLLGNPAIDRVVGRTFEQTGPAFDASQTGDREGLYRERLAESGYDVEDVGIGQVQLATGATLLVRAAWHMYHPSDPEMVVGSQGGIDLDDVTLYTTTADFETTAELNVEEFERRDGLLRGDSGYQTATAPNQFDHWIKTIQGTVAEPIPTGELAMRSMVIMEGMYLSEDQGTELTSAEIEAASESRTD